MEIDNKRVITKIRNAKGQMMENPGILNDNFGRLIEPAVNENHDFQLARALCWSVLNASRDVLQECKMLLKNKKDIIGVGELINDFAPSPHALGLTSYVTSLIEIHTFTITCFSTVTPYPGTATAKEEEEKKEKAIIDDNEMIKPIEELKLDYQNQFKEDLAQTLALIEAASQEAKRVEEWLFDYFCDEIIEKDGSDSD